MTLALPFVFVFLSVCEVGRGGGKEHDCLSHPPITLPENRQFFFFIYSPSSDKVLKIVQLQTSMTGRHVYLRCKTLPLCETTEHKEKLLQKHR